MKHNKFHSYVHSLCSGCRMCVKGRKTVVFITGLCPRTCFYCPLSDKKYKKDVIYANERKVNSIKEIAEEIKVSKSKGCSITGGEPLAVIERTIKTIKEIKKAFGKKFHIHLYTSLNLADENKLRKLYDAGLDEIRFHPDFDDDMIWEKVKLASLFKWKKGIEIPVIPGYEAKTMGMVRKLSGEIDFLNLNELEISDGKGCKLGEMGFVCKDKLSYAIKGSSEMARGLIKKIKKEFPELNIHYCTAKLKDAVQLANRIKIRAQSIRMPFDIVDEEGMLVRGVVYAGKESVEKIRKQFKIPESMIAYDSERKQILIAPWILADIYKKIKEKCALVTEYPTHDRLVVEVNNLN